MSANAGFFERRLRALAYDILCVRDRQSGWKPHRLALLKAAGQSPAAVRAECEAGLQRIVRHAYESSSYYRAAFDGLGIDASRAMSAEMSASLPFLTKDLIRERKASMISERFEEHDLHLSYTGGTTGTQTSFYLDHACKLARVGRQWGILELCGYPVGARRGLVWGVHEDLPADSAQASLKQRFRAFAAAQETLRCTLMNEAKMRDYYRRLRRFRPQVLYGYPSALTQLGRYIAEEGLEPIRVPTIITTAERLSEVTRVHLTRLFGGEVFNLYCTREYGCIGFECTRHRGLHIDTGSVFLEIVRDGRQVADGKSGEIVVTDLLNYGMPFIRSRTGDMGALAPEPCSCGLPFPLLTSLEGRASEVLYRPDGSVVPGLMLTDLFADLPGIRFLQFVQSRKDQLEVRLVVAGGFPDEVRREVVRQVRELMGETIEVQIRLVDEIERNPRSGKVREFICTVNPEVDAAWVDGDPPAKERHRVAYKEPG